MTISRVKFAVASVLVTGWLVSAFPASAANVNRDASFLPIPDPSAPGADDTAPVTLVPPAQQAQPVPAITAVTPAPLTTPAATPATPVPAPVVAPAVAATAPSPAPVLASPPMATTPVAPAPTPVPVVATPVAAAAPVAPTVESGKLGDINPEAVGLLAPAEGGLGASLWKGTPRGIIEHLLPAMNLPTTSPTLNNLADRLLLSTASPPEGAASPNNPSLTSMRVEKLIALGDAANAWKLAMLAKSGQVDDITLRLAAENALVSSVGADVCTQVPELIKTHTSPEWQKLLLVCQLRANDTKAAQITLDLLHSQNVKDDIFFEVIEKNIMVAGKYLPRQLTPLKPLTLALLRQIDLPLRAELYAHPDAALIPELLKTKGVEDKARLDLSERAASHGLIVPAALADVYRSQTFTPEVIAGASGTKETGSRLRALLYQAAQLEKTPQGRVAFAVRFARSLDGPDVNGAAMLLAAQMIGDVAPSADYNASSDTIVLINILAGKPEVALNWLKIARPAAIGIPSVAVGLQTIWPLTAPVGLESDKEYARDLNAWLDTTLTSTDPKADARSLRSTAASVLLLLEADGFAVPEESWAKVADSTGFEKHQMPSAFLIDRLRMTGTLNHRGEAVMDGLLAVDPNGDTPLSTTLDIIRALRLNGLTADAANLTRETMASLLLTPPK